MKNFVSNAKTSDEIKNNISNLTTEYENLLVKLSETNDEIEIIHKVKPNLLGKEGAVSKLFALMTQFTLDERKEFAKNVNEMKNSAESKVLTKLSEIEKEKIAKKLESEKIDPTIPALDLKIGSVHVITKAANDLIEILRQFGFNLYDGPEIDTVDNNFTKLNISETHPARQMHDTFYLQDQNEEANKDYILRTHTSTIQIHAMQNQTPPIRGISFGRVFRFDSDATHSPMFHQMEAFCVDSNITMANLTFLINTMLEEFFETKLNVRLRPSFFPFTEPSCEVDISYIKEGNKIKIAKSDTYLEIGGCGMINDKVLENCGIDSKKYQGFAFGFGVDRMAMLKYGLPDIRKFYHTSKTWIENNNIKHFDI